MSASIAPPASLIVFSHLRWNFVFQRPQHLLTRLAKRYRIYFFEEPVPNQAHEHLQHDVYGQIILSTTQAFFDERLLRPATLDDFRALEPIAQGEAAHHGCDRGAWTAAAEQGSP